MFFGRGRFLRLILVILVGGLLLGAAGRFSYNAGWAAGRAAAASGETGATETALPPTAPRPAPFFGWGFGLLGWIVAGLFKFWLFLLLIGLGFKLLFGWRWRRGPWRRHGRGYGPPWRGHRGWHRPPWHGPEGHQPHEKSPEDVEPDIRSA